MASVSPELWRQAEALFEAALDRAPAERADFVRRICRDDRGLLAAVESLLVYDEQDQPFLDQPLGRLRPPPRLDVGGDWRGRQLGRYRILHLVDHGGMSNVYLGERVDDIEKRVAIKVIEDRPGIARLFRQERSILARLDHPNIARFLDGGSTEEGRSYLVMEYVEGVSITEYCDARRLGIRPRLELFLKVCRAVQYAHQHLIVHRDLKPGNILVTDAGEPKLLDFGIAKLLSLTFSGDLSARTVTRERFLTPGYASPEQLAGRPITTASDVYSLGVILYQLLTARLPQDPRPAPEAEASGSDLHEPRAPSEALSAGGPDQRDQEAIAAARGTRASRLRRQLRGDLDNIVLRCLRPEPRERYSSVEQLVKDVRRHLQGLPVRARPPRLAYRLGKLLRRHALAATALAVAVVALAGFVVTMLLQSERVARERDAARRAEREAEQIVQVLTDAFRLADPYQSADLGRAAGDEVTVREVLDYSAERMVGDFAGQPAFQARLLTTLGRVYHDLGRTEEGIRLLGEALAIRRRLSTGPDLAVVESLNHLGSALVDAGKLAEAEQLLREALGTCRKLPDSELQTADSLSFLGLLLLEKGEYQEAEPLLREALARRRRLEGSETRLVAKILMNLGAARWLAGDPAAAEPPLREALAILRTAAGEEHPDVATALGYLGSVLAMKNDHDAAEPLLRESLEIRRRLLGPEHPETLDALASLADFLLKAGDYRGAEAILRQALDRDRKIQGEAHPDVAIDLHSLALSVWEQGELAEAEELLRQAVARAEAAWGSEHRGTIAYHYHLGELLNEIGNRSEAETILRRVLASRSRLLGPGHRSVGLTMATLADLLAEDARFDEALPLAERAVTVLSAARPEGGWRIPVARSVLGFCLAGQGRYREAEKLLSESLAAIEAERGATSRFARLARRRLVRLYEVWGRPAATGGIS